MTNRQGAAPHQPIEFQLRTPVDIATMLDGMEAWFAAREDLAPLLYKAALVTEELAINAFNHGGAAQSGGVRVQLDRHEGGICCFCSYRGGRFDPCDPANVVDDDPKTPGGQGVRLVQAMTTLLEHRFKGGSNVVYFEIALASGSA